MSSFVFRAFSSLQQILFFPSCQSETNTSQGRRNCACQSLEVELTHVCACLHLLGLSPAVNSRSCISSKRKYGNGKSLRRSSSPRGISFGAKREVSYDCILCMLSRIVHEHSPILLNLCSCTLVEGVIGCLDVQVCVPCVSMRERERE